MAFGNNTTSGGARHSNSSGELMARAIIMAQLQQQQQPSQNARLVVSSSSPSVMNAAAASSSSNNNNNNSSSILSSSQMQAFLRSQLGVLPRSASVASSSDSGGNMPPRTVSESNSSNGDITNNKSPPSSSPFLGQLLTANANSQQQLAQIQQNTQQLQQLARAQQPQRQQAPLPQQQPLPPLLQQLLQQQAPQQPPQAPVQQQQNQPANVTRTTNGTAPANGASIDTQALTQSLARVIESRLQQLQQPQSGNAGGDQLGQSLLLIAGLLSKTTPQSTAAADPNSQVPQCIQFRTRAAAVAATAPAPATTSTQDAVASAQDAAANAASAAASSKKKAKSGKGRTGTFPQKMHQMLSDLEQQGRMHVASFTDQGKAFCIHRPQEFVDEAMSMYFKMTTYASFQRQLNLYDFVRINEGPARGSYHHPLFIKGQPLLSATMKRSKTKGLTAMQYAQKLHEEQQARDRAQEMLRQQQQGQQPAAVPSQPNWASFFQGGSL